jgi:hypothetical protein
MHKGDKKDDDDDDDDDDNNNNNVKVQNIFHCRNNSTCSKIVNTEQLQHYKTQKHGLFQVYNCK